MTTPFELEWDLVQLRAAWGRDLEEHADSEVKDKHGTPLKVGDRVHHKDDSVAKGTVTALHPSGSIRVSTGVRLNDGVHRATVEHLDDDGIGKSDVVESHQLTKYGDPHERSARGIETAHPADTERLMHYWAEGEGAAKIDWGVGGDFDRCRVELGKYVDPGEVDGLCANLHHRATGAWPGHAPGEQIAGKAK